MLIRYWKLIPFDVIFVHVTIKFASLLSPMVIEKNIINGVVFSGVLWTVYYNNQFWNTFWICYYKCFLCLKFFITLCKKNCFPLISVWFLNNIKFYLVSFVLYSSDFSIIFCKFYIVTGVGNINNVDLVWSFILQTYLL